KGVESLGFRGQLTLDFPDAIKKQAEEIIKYHRKALRNAIGYTLDKDDIVIFHNRKLGRKNFLSIIIAYFRSILRG
ncbi:hypothetical protein DW158_19710, partial [Parabacteroides merdae]